MSQRSADVAVNPSGVRVPLRVNSSNELLTAGGGSGGGGDASAANQALEIAELTALNGTSIQIGTLIDVNNGVALDSQTYLFTISSKFPTAATPANNATAPSCTSVRAIAAGIEPNSGHVYNADVDVSRRLQVVANAPNAATTSNSTTWQVQRRAAAFSCTVRKVRFFSRAAAEKYVVLVDNSTTVSNGDMPKGACIFKVPASDGASETWANGLSFTSGCCIALCDSVDPTITLSGTADALFTVQLD